MGSLFEYRCPNCRFSAMVSGGDDCGRASATTTILCEDCRELSDELVSRQPWDEKTYKKPFCPRNRKHKVRKWKHPDVCPKCGEVMEQGSPTILWD